MIVRDDRGSAIERVIRADEPLLIEFESSKIVHCILVLLGNGVVSGSDFSISKVESDSSSTESRVRNLPTESPQSI